MSLQKDIDCFNKLDLTIKFRYCDNDFKCSNYKCKGFFFEKDSKFKEMPHAKIILDTPPLGNKKFIAYIEYMHNLNIHKSAHLCEKELKYIFDKYLPKQLELFN